MAYYRPQAEGRQAALGDAAVWGGVAGGGGDGAAVSDLRYPGIALLFIDVQNYNCSRQGVIYQALSEEQRQSPETRYFFERVEGLAAGVEVMYTVIQSLTRDGRDRSRDYKLSGFHVPPGCWDAEVLPCCAPTNDDIVLPKTSSSVFLSTHIDYILRNLGVRQLVLTGCVTDQCVEHAVRDACDLGYLVTLVPDACATFSDACQAASLAAVAGYCRQRTTAEVAAELGRLAQQRGSAG